MRSAKVNIYISYTAGDRAYLAKLLQWLYPMRDEVNLWYFSPPGGPETLAFPWQILLFWYSPPDPRQYYAHTLSSQVESAHIYLFLTSYRSLIDRRVEEEITAAVNRHVEHGDKFVRVFPVVVSPSHWKNHSRLARFKTLGPKKPLSQIQPEEEGYLELTEQLSKEIKTLQRNLDELKFARLQPGESPQTWPALLGEVQTFQAPEAMSPPEWLGWVIIAALVLSVWYSISPSLPSLPNRRYQNIEHEHSPPEFPREYPLMPPPPGTDTLLRKIVEDKAKGQ